MSENKHPAPMPRAPHIDTLRDASMTILDRTGTRLLCWCPRHECGAIYHVEAMVWSMESPIAFGEFLHALQHRSLAPETGTDDLARWIEACTQPPAGVMTAPGGRC